MKNKKVISLIISLSLLLLIGGTYALISSGIFIKNGSYLAETMDKCINNVNFQVNDLDNSEITGTLFPSANASKGIKSKISISVNHTCNTPLMESFYIHLNNNTSNKYIETVLSHCENPNTLEVLNNYQTPETCIDSKNYWITNGTALKYAVYDNDTATGTPLKVGYINSIDNDILILEGIPATSETTNYYIYLWLDGYLSDNSYADLSLSGNIKANVEMGVSLYETIKSRLDTSKIINFNYTSEGRTTSNGTIAESQITNGVYLFDGTDGTGDIPIYYFRGAVNNNNVLFNNICWKIVRTTGTGGIKLIYNGIPDNNQCTKTTYGTSIGGGSKYDSEKYMYETMNENEETVMISSNIKKYIDDWYKNNMTNVTEKLEDTIWCNDMTKFPNEKSYFSALTRLNMGISPKLSCDNENDRYTTKNSAIGNKLLDYPVAMLTADEIRLAGIGGMGRGSHTYYINSGQHFWTLSPSRGTSIFYVYIGNYLSIDMSIVQNGAYIRPSISLMPGITYSSGDGSMERPFIIE